ncbi:hypothetical protein RB599_003970 [Gaeumannomyces hyphopodioides]
MSGLEALGLVCNIFAVVDFSIKTVKFCKAVYEGAALDADRLSAVCASLETSTQDLRRSYYAVTEARTKAEQDILDLSQKCQVAARELQEEVKFLTDGNAKGSLIKTVVVAIRKGWRKRRIHMREKSLEEFKALLETQLLFQILSKTQAIALTRQHEFSTFDQQLQHFVTQYAEGHTKLGDLVKAETQTVTAATRAEGQRLEKELKEHTKAEVIAGVAANSERLHQLRIDGENAARLQKLLGSFKFLALNERRNHVTQSLEGTFDWILDGDTGDVQPWDNFLDWLRSESKKYWIQGKPGSGKSTLVKFLLHDPRTHQAVEIWRPNTLIISHFFWGPGSILQRNIKGLLCSLMHQLGSASNAVLQSLLDGDTTKSLESKDSDADWSVEGLQSVLHETLSLLQRPLCVFIDGLDEICPEDGSWRLMKVIDGLVAFPRVKVCLASRPELRFKTHLDQQPQLRVQDLTRDDMERYVDDKLSPLVELKTVPDLSSLEAGGLQWELIGKAEGVFLWLHLATNSIVRGLENGETLQEVSIRLNDLPSDLAKLYSDLWKRLNDDTPSHRQEGARYLNIILEKRNRKNDLTFSQDLSLLECAIIADTSIRSKLCSNIQQAVYHSSECIPPDLEAEILQSCHQTEKHVLLRCAGLVEFVEVDTGDAIPSERVFARKVKLIHRTAWDFLTDMEEGRHIRSYDLSSPESRHIDNLYASLASVYLRPLYLWTGRVVHPNRIRNIMSQLEELSDQTDPEIPSLLRFCWVLYDIRNAYALRGAASLTADFAKRQQHFLAFAARRSRWRDFVFSSILNSPDSRTTATFVLQDLFTDIPAPTMDHEDNIDFLIPRLLELGADASMKAFYISSFASFLQMAFHRGYGQWALDHIMAFHKHGVNLEEHLAVCVSLPDGSRAKNFGLGACEMLLEVNASFVALCLLGDPEAKEKDSISPGRRSEVEDLLTNPFGRIRYFGIEDKFYRLRGQAISNEAVDISIECQHLDPRKLDFKRWASTISDSFRKGDGTFELVEGDVLEELAREGACGLTFVRPVRDGHRRMIGVEPSPTHTSREDWERNLNQG